MDVMRLDVTRLPTRRDVARGIAATAAAENTAVASFDQDFRKFTDVRVETE
jgi:predicted nucleic acid-binding protein